MLKIKNLLYSTFNKLKTNDFFKSVAILSTGNIIAQTISIFSLPLVSRLYSPASFGDFALIISISSIISYFSTLGLPSAILKPESNRESKEIISTHFTITLILSALIILILVLFSVLFKVVSTNTNYLLFCISLFPIVITTSLVSSFSIYINKQKKNNILFYNSIIGSLSTLLITVPLGLLNFGIWGLYFGTLISGIAQIYQMVLAEKNMMVKINFSIIKCTIKKYKEYVKYQYPSNFIVNITSQLPLQYFYKIFGSQVVGNFAMSEKLFGIPMKLLASPISTVYFRTISEKQRSSENNFADFTFKYVIITMLIAIIPLSLVIFTGQFLVDLILGPKWSLAGQVFAILALQYVFIFCDSSTSYLRVAINKQRINLIMSLLKVFVIVSSIFLGFFFLKDFILTLTAYSFGVVVYQIIDMAINFYCLGKFYIKYLLFSITYVLVFTLIYYSLYF